MEVCAKCLLVIARGEKVYGAMHRSWVGGNTVNFEEIFYHDKCADPLDIPVMKHDSVSELKRIFKEQRIESATRYRRV